MMNNYREDRERSYKEDFGDRTWNEEVSTYPGDLELPELVVGPLQNSWTENKHYLEDWLIIQYPHRDWQRWVVDFFEEHEITCNRRVGPFIKDYAKDVFRFYDYGDDGDQIEGPAIEITGWGLHQIHMLIHYETVSERIFLF